MDAKSERRADQAFQRVMLTQLMVARMMAVPLLELCGNTRGDPHAAFARQAAMYLCHAVFALQVNAIAKAFGRDCSTVRHAIRRIDYDREADGECDRVLAWLEYSLRQAGGYHV